MHFTVFKVSFKREECEWDETVEYVELKSLGDEALFVGDNYFVSILASKCGGCQSNCIYYIDDSINFRQNVSIACDMGIYSTGSFQYVIEDESFEVWLSNS
ncbi:putative F-box protein [Prunus yedoensis var. nudiflora]|uniref:Putative F-box protein n=1 Tax=Prunus yedoensis var. nudiflora TaxID=2094558 RepID=A0A314ZLP5_PRUYE|nr:putative F-box protein [Prunus yedoensis var. nudiflora]